MRVESSEVRAADNITKYLAQCYEAGYRYTPLESVLNPGM
jgi:hypothetical protein